MGHLLLALLTGLRLLSFDVDATPPVGSELTYQTMRASSDFSLRTRGIVLFGAGAPIVLCSVDWIGIANEGHDAFREALAQAAGTTIDRVEVHTVHQHDTPICDFTAEKILMEKGMEPAQFEGSFARSVIRELRDVIRRSFDSAEPVTAIGFGKAKVRKVASNRTVKLKDGTFDTRYSSEPNRPEYRKMGRGLVDPEVSLVSFWNGKKPLAALSFYATHPQSYYLTGVTSPDFPGIARAMRDLDEPDVLHVHFNGAGGNIAAGKYNDGSHRMRKILATRLEKGMRKAWKRTKRQEITSIRWETENLLLPPAPAVGDLETTLPDLSRNEISNSVSKLGWYRRRTEGKGVQASCLTVNNNIIMIFLPGELFVEYQLAAKRMAKGKSVAMAAYGDYGPFYIGTKEAYRRGGYEISSSPVTEEVEDYLLGKITSLLARSIE